MVPDVIVFERLLKHDPATIAAATKSPAQPEPVSEEEVLKSLSPLERRRAKMLQAAEPQKTPEELEAERKSSAEALERERKAAEEGAERVKEIHGSVSARDIAGFISEKLLLDPEAARIQVQPGDIRFVGHATGLEKIEKIGRFDIEIRTHAGKDRVEPFRKTVEVKAAAAAAA